MTVWEAYNGLTLVEAGKRRSGKPHTALLINVLVCTSEADAKRVMRAHPGLKFVKRVRRRSSLQPSENTKP